MKLNIRELKVNETDKMLELRNSHFGVISREHWDALESTAIVAKKGKDILGAIPMQPRNLMIKPGVTIPVMFENAVGVSKKLRGQGIGSKMINEAAIFFKDRTDAFCVYRGGERTNGYRFYRKTMHGDIYYVSGMIIGKPKGCNNDVKVYNWNKTIELEKQLFECFNKVYKNYGGYWERKKGYFKKVVNSYILKEHNIKLYVLEQKNKIKGFAIADPQAGGFRIYDIVAPTYAIAKKLLDKLSVDAKKDKTCLLLWSSSEEPIFNHLLKYGFKCESNRPLMLARIINGKNIYKKLIKNNKILKNVEVKIATPHRDDIVNKPKQPTHKIEILLKESFYSKLFLCRLDYKFAVESSLLRTSPMPKNIHNELCKIFKFVPWFYSGIDWI